MSSSGQHLLCRAAAAECCQSRDAARWLMQLPAVQLAYAADELGCHVDCTAG